MGQAGRCFRVAQSVGAGIQLFQERSNGELPKLDTALTLTVDDGMVDSSMDGCGLSKLKHSDAVYWERLIYFPYVVDIRLHFMNDKIQAAGLINTKASQNLTLTFLVIHTIIVEKITSMITGRKTVSSLMLMIYGF